MATLIKNKSFQRKKNSPSREQRGGSQFVALLSAGETHSCCFNICENNMCGLKSASTNETLCLLLTLKDSRKVLLFRKFGTIYFPFLRVSSFVALQAERNKSRSL